MIPFNSLGFTRTGNHWVGQHSSSSPQTAGVQHTTGFSILGSQNPTNVRLDGNPIPYTVLTDTQAPTTPSNVLATRATYPGVGTGVTLWWTASTDNFAVTGYEVTVNGVVISRVDPTGAGFQALLRRGFVIMEINKRPVKNVAEYQRIVAAARPGEILAMYVYDPTLSQRSLMTVTVE